VFQFLDYCDELSFSVRTDGQLRQTTVLAGVTAEQDLCLRAARLLRERAATGLGADISVTKRIPMGGGLGGGSSDAATTLIALNRLWGLGLPPAELAAIGLELGADVPVFVHGRAAWGEGVGERLEPLDLPEPWFVVVVPPVQVSTALIFREFAAGRSTPDGGSGQLTHYRPPITIRDFRAGAGENDLEPLVRKRYPEVDQALRWLSRYGAGARMTGSGACVFLEQSDEAGARDILGQLPPPMTGFVARGLNRSPVLNRLARGVQG